MNLISINISSIFGGNKMKSLFSFFGGRKKRAASKPCLLVVEDSSDDIFFLKGFIEHTGNTCDVEKTAEGALGRLRSKQYNIVFVDCRLPHESGTDLINEISIDFPTVNIVVTPGEITDLSGVMPGLFLSIISKPISQLSIKAAIDKLGGSNKK